MHETAERQLLVIKFMSSQASTERGARSMERKTVNRYRLSDNCGKRAK